MHQMISVPKQLLIQAVFIAINAIFAALEMAMVSLNVTKLKMLEDEGDKSATRMLKMLENPAGFLSAIQVAISLSGFLGSAFAADSLSEPLTDWLISIGIDSISYATLNSISVVIITVILTLVTIVFGELVPKRVAQQKSFAVAKFSAGVITATAKIMRPAVWLLTATTNLVLRICRMNDGKEDDSVTEDDIKLMVDAGGESGSIEEDEKECGKDCPSQAWKGDFRKCS